MFRFYILTNADKEKLIHPRSGEIRLGEQIRCSDDFQEDALNSPEIKFVIVGFPEDIGVRANLGVGGADTAWLSFLKTFLNIQETEQLSGKDFLLYGCLMKEALAVDQEESSVESLRKQTADLDDLLFPVIERIIKAGKIPIIIGGGHNNAYPNLKGAYLAKGQPVNAINIDAHADFRAIEGRHSGNGFSYALMKGYLKKYFVLGLHEAYNNKEMLHNMNETDGIDYIFWEDIFIRQKMTWQQGLEKGIKHVADDFFGVEMDVDCIEHVLSSAATPLGIYMREAMLALYQCGRNPNAIYLHIPEAITQRADGQENSFAGKTLSYLVQAFSKGVKERDESPF